MTHLVTAMEVKLHARNFRFQERRARSVLTTETLRQLTVELRVSPRVGSRQCEYIDKLRQLLCRTFRTTEVVALHGPRRDKLGAGAAVIILTSLHELEQCALLEESEIGTSVIVYLLEIKQFQSIDARLLKSLNAKRLSVVYPNECRLGFLAPTEAKVVDTLIHRLVGPKYSSRHIHNDLVEWLGDEAYSLHRDARSLGQLLESGGLNPDRTAGAIAIRHDKGTFITSTSTDKYDIPFERVCLITDYDPATNEVSWVGNLPPSSESPLAYLAFREIAGTNILLHFHFKPVTYSPALEWYHTSGYVPYGTYEEATLAIDKLQETDGFAILHGHGELVIGSSSQSVRDRLRQIVQNTIV